MATLFKNFSRILTLQNEKGYLFNLPEEKNLSILNDFSIVVEEGVIKDFLQNSNIIEAKFEKVVDCRGKLALPGFVECHTHTVFAGSRGDEFKLKLQGVDYEEIARRGGGIISTVKATRKASEEELLNLAKPRAWEFISQGVTTLEIKSGYGLDFETEVKLLRVINRLNRELPIEIVPTFLGAHAYPPEFKENHSDYVKILTERVIPYVAQNNLARSCDAFCELTAFSPEEVRLVFASAKEQGMNLKLHTDQFNSIGGIDVALEFNARSVEHLEAVTDDALRKLNGQEIVAVLLPGVSFFLKYQYAPAKKLIKNNVPVAFSTDFNPGSSHILNLHLIMQLATFEMNLTAEQILPGVTINAARALGLSHEIGSLQIGKNADFAIFEAKDYSDIIYNVGRNLLVYTVKKGNLVYSKIRN